MYSIALSWRYGIPGTYRVKGIVQVHDSEETLLRGVAVLASWDGVLPPLRGVTDYRGNAIFKLKTTTIGSHGLCVSFIYGLGHVYDPSSNHITCRSVFVGP